MNNETTALLNRLPLIIALKDLHTRDSNETICADASLLCKQTNTDEYNEAELFRATERMMPLAAGSKWHTIKMQLLHRTGNDCVEHQHSWVASNKLERKYFMIISIVCALVQIFICYKVINLLLSV